MTISATEYEGKYPSRKTVSHDGIEFEIRRLSPIDLWSDSDGKRDNAKMTKTMLLKGVISPKLSDGPTEGCLDIASLTFEHITWLIGEISEFSGITKDGKPADFKSPRTPQ